MKKLLMVLVALLIVWNIFLTIKVLEKESVEVVKEETVVQTVSTSFDTNITQVVEETINQVVNISNVVNQQAMSSGSGVVIEKEGDTLFIITNHHVIENAQDIIISFNNGQNQEASLVGSDAFSDLALLEIEVDFDLQPIQLGDSDLSQVGETVVAIGSPLGQEFAGSVTMGIISGKERLVEVDTDGNGIGDWDMLLLQTDAAINPGNSGGALVNMNGELIGINTLKFADNRVEGMGFSVPVNEIKSVVDSFQEHGRIVRPFVGISSVSVDELNPITKQTYGILPEVNKGLLVMGVQANSPADQAMIRQYDLITHFDGIEIETFKDFRKLLYEKEPGDVIVLSIDRVGRKLDLEVTLDD